MRNLAILLSLLANSLCLAGPTAKSRYETRLSREDLEKMQAKSKVTLSETWQNQKGFVINCLNGICSVSCEPQPAMDAPEVTLTGKRDCRLSLAAQHFRAYLQLISRARQGKRPQWDPMKIALCDSGGCTLYTDRKEESKSPVRPR